MGLAIEGDSTRNASGLLMLSQAAARRAGSEETATPRRGAHVGSHQRGDMLHGGNRGPLGSGEYIGWTYIGWTEMDRQLVATPTMRHGESTAVIHLTGNKAEHFGEWGAGSVSYLRCVETPVGGFVRLPATDL